MALWSWRDLERRVCGERTVDLALLRKHARYEELTADSAVVGHLQPPATRMLPPRH